MKKQLTAVKPDVEEIVTDRILASLKNGIILWEQPWTSPNCSGGQAPRTLHTTVLPTLTELLQELRNLQVLS